MKLGLGLGLNRGRRGGGAAGAVGILDSYTGAAFAFAPDTLIYSGFSVTDNTSGSNTNGSSGEFTVLVRRDSDNALQSFTWEEMSDGTLVTWVGAGNNGFVQVAYDQSGNDNHASQTTAANQPKIVDNGVLVVENGKAALEFLGASLRLPTRPTGGVINFYNIFNNASTLSSAVSTNGDSGGRYGVVFEEGSNISLVYNTSYYSGTVNLYHNSTSVAPTTRGAADAIIGTTQALWVEEISNLTQTSYIEYGYSFNTSINFEKRQLMLFYLTDQSSNRTAIETAINNEYLIY